MTTTQQPDRILWFDLETTSVNPTEARIVQVAAVLTDMNFTPVSDVIETLVNPEVEIPADTIEVHGITNEMVANAPKFRDVASGLVNFIGTAHIGGYNVIYDIQVLLAELDRLGIEFDMSNRMIIDPLTTLRIKEPRDQSTVYTYYTGETLENAHNASADIMATLRIAVAQKQKYADVNTAADMYNLSEPQNRCDLAGKIKMKDGIPVFTFGKHYNQPISENKSYLVWMLSADMPGETKKWINNYLSKENGTT